ncbi:uncharacterized protein [Choristoneura fumiferana]|uniref:uncharacterized protein n=1 Tax=Choristoneura fumiferana TaxID=7141 RepID=UPI003D1556A8
MDKQQKITKYERKIEKLRKKIRKNAGRRSRSRTRSRSPLQTRAGPSAPRRIVTEYDKGPEDGTIHEDDAAREDDTGPEDNDDDDVPSDAAPDTEADTEGHIQPQPNPLLLALGLDEVAPNRWGPNILAELASKWSETLKNGIRKEEKELMLKAYLVPENCQLLSPPLLNGEVNAAINEACKNRDKTLANKQKELGLALTALGLAITELLKESPDNIKIMKLLSDTGRILTDLHHGENITRKVLIAPLLDKNFSKMTEEVTRDEFLFGTNLSDRIKDKITIEKSSQQIKRPQPIPTKPAPRQGNWNGPPRAYTQSKMMGRGGLRRPAPPSSQQKKPAQPSARRPQAHRPERSYQRARGRR